MCLPWTHHWETPRYNEALNLREGLQKCQKCQSIRGYRRFVPLEYDALRKIDPRLPARKSAALLIVGGLALIGFGCVSASVIASWLQDQQETLGGNSTATMQAILGIAAPVVLISFLGAGAGLIMDAVRPSDKPLFALEPPQRR